MTPSDPSSSRTAPQYPPGRVSPPPGLRRCRSSSGRVRRRVRVRHVPRVRDVTAELVVEIEFPPGLHSRAAAVAVAEAVIAHPGNQRAVVVMPSEEGVYRVALQHRVDAFHPGLADALAAAANCETRLVTV